MCGGAIGKSLAWSDKWAKNNDPVSKSIMQSSIWANDQTVGRISPSFAKMGDSVARHPAEDFLALAALYAGGAYLGAGAAGAEAAGGAAAAGGEGGAGAAGMSSADAAALYGDAGYGAAAGDAAGAGAAGVSSADAAALYGDAGYGAAGGGAGMSSADAAALYGDAGYTGASSTADAGFLPVTSGSTPLSPDVASMLGVDTGAGVGADATTVAGTGGGADLSTMGLDTTLTTGDAGGAGGGGIGSDAWKWIKAHPVQAGQLGLAGMNAFRQPALPSAGKTAQGAATAEVQSAQGVIASGGTSSPQWQAMKSSIDAQISANLQNAMEAMQQQMANSGMGGTNSAVVQQKMFQLTQQAETERAALYEQALGQIVSQAVSELSGGNATLTQIANMQLAQSQQARQVAAQTAELSLLLSSKGGG